MSRFMSWETAIERFKIPKMYKNASMDSVSLKTPKIATFAEGWLASKCRVSLFIYGNTGSGKTYFAFALLKRLVDLNIYDWIIFIRSDDLDNELLRAAQDNQETSVLEKYSEVPILFIDDLGVERPTDRVIKQYYNIIDRRLSNYLTTVFTSNLEADRISSNLGDRISSRLQLTEQIRFPKRDLRKH